jgi:superfamily II DNA or RNA helicase
MAESKSEIPKQTTEEKKSGIRFPERNTTDFPLTVAAGLNALMENWNPDGFLKKHQFLPVQFAMNTPSSRGLLVCASMGRGKTITASALAWYLKKKYPKYKVIVMAALTLEGNFRGNARKFLRAIGVSSDEIDKFLEEYHFVPLNSGAMYSKLARVGKSEEQLQFEDQLKVFNTKVSEVTDFLENSILIVDEAHNLFNAITNGSNNAISFYNTVMATKNIKFFPLTGTPITKHPFETVPCYNMLGTHPGSLPLLPETLYDFNNMFIDADGKSPKNEHIFTNRIFGLTTYYGSLYEDEQPEGYPKLLPTEIRKVPMSQYQWSSYALARMQEKDVTSSKYKKIKAAQERFGRADTVSTYRVASRQISNFAFPEYALQEIITPGPGGLTKTRVTGNLSKLKLESLDRDQLSIYSPKMEEMIKEIYSSFERGEKRILVYSSFVTTGLGVLAKALIARGWKEWTPTDAGDNTEDTYDMKKPYRFARITGEVLPDDRDIIKNHFNNTEDIQIIMISSTGTEGLNLLRGRVELIMEPFWYYERINQVIHRFYRYEGHKDLPPEQRTVRVVVFLSVVPDISNIKEEDKTLKNDSGFLLINQPTTDEHLWYEALKGKELNDKFMLMQVESSIDCSIHYPHLPDSVRKKIKCKTCAPTHKPLFNDNVMDDLKYPNPCKTVTENTIRAKEIVLDDGTKYYYTYNPEPFELRIFMYDPRISGYVSMPKNHPQYLTLYNLIMDFSQS